MELDLVEEATKYTWDSKILHAKLQELILHHTNSGGN